MRAWGALGLVGLIAGCGDSSPGIPADAATHDSSPPADAATDDAGGDAAAPDAAPTCDETPSLPAALACAQSAAWAAYVGDEIQDGRFEIFLVAMDGAPGAPSPASDSHNVRAIERPTSGFAPDAGHIAFVSADDDARRELYVVPVTASGPGEIRQVSGPFKVDGDVTWWAWSPDGRKVAYIADQEHESVPELWVLDLASDGYAQRVNAPFDSPGWVDNAGEVPFSWSPDSSMLAFRAGQSDLAFDELYVADVSGASPASPVPLTLDIDEIPRRWTWAPDSRSIVFYLVPSGSLHVARIACGALAGRHVVSAAASLSEVMSADGEQLTYLARTGDDSAALFRADLTATPPVSTQISEQGEVRFDSLIAWSPVAPRVAFRTRRRLEVLDGTTGLLRVVNGPLVAGGWVHSFSWSPDGQSIAYIANQLDYDQNELFHVDMSGTGPAQRRRVSLAAAHDVLVHDMWWSPDSTHLAYRANQDVSTRIELYDAARSDGVIASPVKLNPDLARDGASVLQVRWSPDSARLLYNSNDVEAFVIDAFVVSRDNPGDALPVNGGPDAVDLAWASCP